MPPDYVRKVETALEWVRMPSKSRPGVNYWYNTTTGVSQYRPP